MNEMKINFIGLEPKKFIIKNDKVLNPILTLTIVDIVPSVYPLFTSSC